MLLYQLTSHTGIPALFEFGVEGDAAFDPNFMILWFQQPSLGLPSKVGPRSPRLSLVFKQILGILRRQDDARGLCKRFGASSYNPL